MRRQIVRLLAVASAVATTFGLAIPTAMASGTWTVTGGPNFSAVFSSGTTFTMTDATSNLSFTCTVGTETGTVTDQSSSANTAIGHITGSSLGNSAHKCNGPLGWTLTATQPAGTTETLNAVSYDSAAKVVTATITGTDLRETISSILGSCTAEIKGTFGVTYNDKTSELQFVIARDSAEITSTIGACAGIIAVDDQITFQSGSGGETITGSPSAPIAIEQP
jgi:hypothetical protein